MSDRFGSMPADREIAAFGCGFGALILGLLTPDLVSIAMGRTVAVASSQRPWWFVALLAATALALAIQVTGRVLRIALIAFAVARVMSISAVSSALAISALAVTMVNGLFACALLVAAWPKANRLARVVALVLFTSAVVFTLLVRRSASSVFG